MGLDVLRAVAVMLVLGRHMRSPPAGAAGETIGRLWQTGGWVGVDLFFVLSGFLVSGLLFREHQRSGQLCIRTFYLRRALRIYPAFLVFLGFSSLLFAFSGGSFPTARLAAELSWTQSYQQGLWGHTWSLAVEEHFYLILPLVLWAMCGARCMGIGPMAAGRSRPFRFIPLLFSILAATSLLLRWANADRPFSDLTHLFPSHLRMDSLFFGVLLSYLHHHQNAKFILFCRRWRPALIATGIVLLAPAFVLPVERVYVHTLGLTEFYLGSGMLVAAAISPPVESWTARVTERRSTPSVRTTRLARSAAYIGSYSYSIYLWHVVVAVILPTVLGPRVACPWAIQVLIYCAVAVGLGVATGKAIERPALRIRDRLFPGDRPPATEEKKMTTVTSTFFNLSPET
jgi:peptidoglycan/LPS O-acetylase OafA/YrhL